MGLVKTIFFALFLLVLLIFVLFSVVYFYHFRRFGLPKDQNAKRLLNIFLIGGIILIIISLGSLILNLI